MGSPESERKMMGLPKIGVKKKTKKRKKNKNKIKVMKTLIQLSPHLEEEQN